MSRSSETPGGFDSREAPPADDVRWAAARAASAAARAATVAGDAAARISAARERARRRLAARSRSLTKLPFLTSSVFFLCLVLVLGATGVANGLWSGNLAVDGLVETGDLNADWQTVTTVDNDATIGVDAPDCSASIGDADGTAPDFGNQVAHVRLTNAYRGYRCTVTGVLTNTGSIPFNLVGVNPVLDTANGEGLEFVDLNGEAAGLCVLPPSHSVDPASDAAIQCEVTVKNTAQNQWTYYFAIEVCVAQWNEDPSSGAAQEDFIACKSNPVHEGPDTPTLPPPGPTSGDGT